MSTYRFYDVEVLFRNEGETYGRETYKVMAPDNDVAGTKALKNASASAYDDPRLPDRRIVVGSCEPCELA